MPPRTQRGLLEDEKRKRAKANADRLSGETSPEARPLTTHVPRHAPANRTEVGEAIRGDATIQRNLMTAAGVPQSNADWDVVPGSAGYSFRRKEGDTRAAVAESIDPRGRTEILEAGDIDFTGTRTALNGSGVRAIRDSRAEHGVSAEDALAILRGNKPPKPDFTVRGTGIPALPSNIEQRRSEFAERSEVTMAGGAVSDRARKLDEIRRPAKQAAAAESAEKLRKQNVDDEIAIKSAAARVTAFSQELRTQWEIAGRGEISANELAEKVAERESKIEAQLDADRRMGKNVGSPEYRADMEAKVDNELLVQASKNEGTLATTVATQTGATERVQLGIDAATAAAIERGENVDTPQFRAKALSETKEQIKVDLAKANAVGDVEKIAMNQKALDDVVFAQIDVVLKADPKFMNARVKKEEIIKFAKGLDRDEAEPAPVAEAPVAEAPVAEAPVAEAPVAAAPVDDVQPFGTTRFGDGDDLNGDGDISDDEREYNDASRLKNNKAKWDALTPANRDKIILRLSELKPIVIGG